MYKVITSLVAAGTLVGCTLTNPLPNNSTSAAVTAFAQQVINGAVTACGYLPTEQAVESIVAVANPALDAPQNVVDVICKAVTVSSSKTGARKFLVNGHPVVVVNGKVFVVDGQFVK